MSLPHPSSILILTWLYLSHPNRYLSLLSGMHLISLPVPSSPSKVGKESGLGSLGGQGLCNSTSVMEEDIPSPPHTLTLKSSAQGHRQTLYLYTDDNYRDKPEPETRECPVLLLGKRSFPDTQLSLTGPLSRSRKERLPDLSSLPFISRKCHHRSESPPRYHHTISNVSLPPGTLSSGR